MDDIENAEVLIQSTGVDFNANKNICAMKGSEIAQDLAFIMENAAFQDTTPSKVVSIETSDEDDSSGEEGSSSSDVEEVDLPKKSKVATICISSDDDGIAKDRRKQQKKGKTESMKKVESSSESSTDDEETENVELMCKMLLRKVIKTVERKEQEENGEDIDFHAVSSSDEVEELTEQDKMNFACIVQSEESVANFIPKVTNEVLPEELEEEDEVIELKEDDTLVPMGLISGIVEKMIVVEASIDAPALDAETAFFTEDKQFLGKVFDTFGPVKTPFYSIRLCQRIDVSKLSRGTRIFFVPFNQNITKYIFVEQLKRIKGSDASWRDDCEPPPQFIDYSDDEEERAAKREKTNKKRQLAQSRGDGETNAMNQRNDKNKNKANPKRKMKVIDLTKHGNPLLEHAREMNGPVAARGKPRPQDVPLSEVMPVEVRDYDNAEMIRESRFEYISPLHQSNPKPNWSNQRGGRGRGGSRGRGGNQLRQNRNNTIGNNESQGQQRNWQHIREEKRPAPYNCEQQPQQRSDFGGQYNQPPHSYQSHSTESSYSYSNPPTSTHGGSDSRSGNPNFDSFVDVSSKSSNNERNRSHSQNQQFHQGHVNPPPQHHGNAPPPQHNGNAPPSQNYRNGPPPQNHGNAPQPPPQHAGNGLEPHHYRNAPLPHHHGNTPPPPQKHNGNAPAPQHHGNAPPPPPPHGNPPPPPHYRYPNPPQHHDNAPPPPQGNQPPPQHHGNAPPPRQHGNSFPSYRGEQHPPPRGSAPPPQRGSAPPPNPQYGHDQGPYSSNMGPPNPSYGYHQNQNGSESGYHDNNYTPPPSRLPYSAYYQGSQQHQQPNYSGYQHDTPPPPSTSNQLRTDSGSFHQQQQQRPNNLGNHLPSTPHNIQQPNFPIRNQYPPPTNNTEQGPPSKPPFQQGGIRNEAPSQNKNNWNRYY